MTAQSVSQANSAPNIAGDTYIVPEHQRRRIPWGAVGRHAFLLLLCLWVLLPLSIVVLNSMKSRVDSAQRAIWPKHFVSPIWASYEWVWRDFTLDNIFFRVYWNSLFVTGLTVFFGTVVAILAGFALSHLATPGKRAVILVLVASLFFPIRITSMIGIFRLHWDLGLIDDTWPLMLPYVAANVAISVFVMRAVFQMISPELPDSARIDGASSLRILLEILLPLVRNGIVVVIVINFMFAWSEYVLASILTNNQTSRTLAVLIGGGGAGPGFSAVFMVALVPGVLALVIAQRWYMKGLQEGALKA